MLKCTEASCFLAQLLVSQTLRSHVSENNNFEWRRHHQCLQGDRLLQDRLSPTRWLGAFGRGLTGSTAACIIRAPAANQCCTANVCHLLGNVSSCCHCLCGLRERAVHVAFQSLFVVFSYWILQPPPKHLKGSCSTGTPA